MRVSMISGKIDNSYGFYKIFYSVHIIIFISIHLMASKDFFPRKFFFLFQKLFSSSLRIYNNITYIYWPLVFYCIFVIYSSLHRGFLTFLQVFIHHYIYFFHSFTKKCISIIIMNIYSYELYTIAFKHNAYIGIYRRSISFD